MRKVLQDRSVYLFLLITIIVGCGFQFIFYITQQKIWLVPAMWAPTLAVLSLGQIGRNILKELKKFPLKWVLIAAGMAVLPYILSQFIYWQFNLGNWNSSFVLSDDETNTITIIKMNFPLGNAKQNYWYFALNLSLLILLLSAVTTLAGALGEEIGWRGFLQKRLDKYFDIFNTTLLVAFVWACNTCANIYLFEPKTEFTANIVNLISYALAWSFFVYLVFRPSRVSRTLHPLSL